MTLTFVECPRDAWQGFRTHIPTHEKRAFLQDLLGAGFLQLDLGSFVSPKAVPQMADTEQVLNGLERTEGSDFLCIIANERGLERALSTPNVSSVGYPLSLSDSFQKRNTGKRLIDAWPLVERLYHKSQEKQLRFVVYLSMGFGNPYGEPWSPADTAQAVTRLRALGIRTIALADTVGTATPERVSEVLASVPAPEALGLHLHARPDDWQAKLESALRFGVRWFEGALAGVGGCPFASDELIGNLPSEQVLPWLQARGLDSGVELAALEALREHAAALKARYG